MKKCEQFSRVTSYFCKDMVFHIANFTSPSTLSNLHTAFFYPKEINYQNRMLGHVKSFCDDYQAKKLTGTNDLERYPNIDDETINELCCLFNFLKNMLIKSKAAFINQYYLSGRRNFPGNFYSLINYFNTVTEALIRFLWLRILFGEGNFNFMVINQFIAAILFKDRYFLNNEQSRLTTRFLNCASQNLYSLYVSVIIDYAHYLGFTNIIFNDELNIKLKCYNFYYPDKYEKTFDLKRFTLVKNRHEKLENDWHYTNDIFFCLKVDNKKFTDKYCATQHILKDHTCLEAAEFVAENKSDAELHEHLSDHSRYVYTNTWDYSDYAGYVLNIKNIDDDATKHYLDFCDTYFREKDKVADEIQDDPLDNYGDLEGPQNMNCSN